MGLTIFLIVVIVVIIILSNATKKKTLPSKYLRITDDDIAKLPKEDLSKYGIEKGINVKSQYASRQQKQLDLSFQMSELDITSADTVVVDIETTGLPLSQNVSPDQSRYWPFIVQMAWIIFDVNGDMIKIENHLFKQEKEIPYEATKIHGISTEKANLEGKFPEIILTWFLRDIKYARLIVAHNTEFDLQIIEAELIRNKFGYQLITKDSICTMKSSVDYCQIPKQYGRGYKYPKLTELVGSLFYYDYDVQIPDAHDAEIDALMTAKCYFKLKTSHKLKLQRGNAKYVSKDYPDYLNIDTSEQMLPKFFNQELKKCSNKILTVEYSTIKRKIISLNKKINFPDKELRPRDRIDLLMQYQTQLNILDTVTKRILEEI